MKVTKTKIVYFSPSGTTEKIAKRIGKSIGGEQAYYDILDRKIEKKKTIGKDEFLVLAMPVFSGRVPEYCLSSIRHIHSNGMPAVIVAVYGNRAYEDALIEMQDMLEERGVKVIGAAAFVGQHSIFTEVAKGRPDEEDLDKLDQFVSQVNKKLKDYSGSEARLDLPGNHDYRKYGASSLTPKTEHTCTKCHQCVDICPVGAIDRKNPRKTDKKKCIMCTACISRCPAHARRFSGVMFNSASKSFKNKYLERKEPEIFI